MRELATTEINEQGIIISTAIPNSTFWNAFLPTIGENLCLFWDDNSSKQLKDFIDQIFLACFPIKLSITIDNCPLQCTAFRSSAETATIFWDTVMDNGIISNSTVNDNRLKLIDYTFKNINNAIIFYRKDGSIYDCNEAFCKMYGVEREGTLTLTLFDFGSGFTKQSFKQYWDRVKALGSFSFYAKRTKADGVEMNVEIIPNYIKYGDTELICSIIRDITEQKQLEDSLVKERTLLRTLIDTLPFPVFVKDAKARKLITNKPDIELLMQLDSEESALGKTDLELFKDNPNHIGYVQDVQVLSTGKPIIEELETFITKKNEKLNFLTTKMPISDGFGNVIGLVGFCKDITETQKLEEELQLVGYAFENVDTAIYFVKKDGAYYKANKAMCLMLGYSIREFLELNVFDINPSLNKESWDEIWTNQQNGVSRTILSRFKNKQGHYIDVEIKSKMISYQGIVLICAFINDISEMKRTEERLKLVDYAFRNASISMQFIKRDGSIYDFNKKSCNILGYTPEEYQNITLFDFTTKHTLESWNTRWEELKLGNNESFVTKIRKKDNSLIDVEIRSNIIQYDNEELTFTSTIDITEFVRTEERLRIVDFAFRNASIPMHFLRKDGSVYDFNHNSPKLLGYSEEEFSKLNIWDFASRHNPETWEKRWEDFKKSNKLASITKIKRKDNSFVDVEIITDIVKYGLEELTFSSVIDLTEKKRIEEKLNIVDHAFRNASIPMIFFRKDGSIYDFNDMAQELLGYSKEEFKHLFIFNISIRHNRETWERRWDALNINKHTTFESKIRRKDNSLLDVEIRSDAFKYENEELSYTSIIDITEKKEAESILKRSNERYENALIATSDVIWEADLINDRTYFSKNFTLIFGHPIKEIEDRLHNTCRINIHPDDVAMVNAIVDDLGNGVIDRWDFEYRMKKADGNYALLLDRGFSVKDEEGKVVRLVGAIQDITKKKAEESRLKLLESVVVHTNDAIVIANARPINRPGPTIIYVNDAYTKITGYSLEESIGTNPRRLQNINTDRKELDRFRKALEQWQPCEMTIRNVRKNGEEFWANIRVTPVANENGIFTHWVSVQRDVTKEIESQKEKESILNELINNNNELKQFGYITTHNLRAPLTNLVAISKLMDESKMPDDFTRKLISGFKQSTFILNDTLDDLIKILFIKERLNLPTTDLRFENVLNKIKDFISNSIESKNVIIEADFSLAPIVKFSTIYLESLFLNLMTNSIKYAHPDRSPRIKIVTILLPDNKVKLTFSDNGLGMNMDRIKGRIFGLYQRFHNNPDSKGLGLYLIHSQITALGGTIDVESNVNVGTTFSIIFKNVE